MKTPDILSFPTIILLLITFLLPGMSPPVRAEGRQVFSTWEGFEVDKCASLWLIKRFIDKDAAIKVYPKGEVIDEGIPFDTPEAKFRRYQNMSTFECLLRNYNLDDKGLLHIGRIVHDIEINTWQKKVIEETPAVQEAVNRIIQESKSSDEIIDKSCKYFDSLYEGLASTAAGSSQ